MYVAMIKDYIEIVRHMKAENKKYKSVLIKLDLNKIRHIKTDPMPIEVWRSNRFAVQIYNESPVRLSIVRTAIKKDGNWKEGISWEELQEIKNQCGYTNQTAIELFPPEKHLVNVANIRHLWIIPDPEFMWRDGEL